MKTLSEQLREFMDQVAKQPVRSYDMTIPWEFEVTGEDGEVDYKEAELGVDYSISGEDRPATYDDPAEYAELDDYTVYDTATGEDITDKLSEDDKKIIEEKIWEDAKSNSDYGDYDDRDDYHDDYAADRAEDAWRGDRF